MKKAISMFLVILLCFALCACGKSEAVKNVEAMIDTLGEITLESIDAICSAEAAYHALTADEQEKVSNYETLTNARDAYYELALIGQWAEPYITLYDVDAMYDQVRMELNADRSGIVDVAGIESFTWSVENSILNIVLPGNVMTSFDIVEENGKIQLRQDEWYWMTVEDYHDYVDSIVKVIDLSEVDISEFCELYFYEEHELDAFDEPTGNVYTRVMIRNKLFDEGWYYYSGTDIAIEVNYPQYTIITTNQDGTTTTSVQEAYTETMPDYDVPFTHNVGTVGRVYANDEGYWNTDLTIDQISFGRTKGVLYFVHSDYVKEVKRGNDGYRILVLINGTEVYTDPWDNIDY